ncbi:hypothetical protein HMI56_005420 [Coelomomyces lativittatus]|nr:hypothetical protein HMI56_005420 [Coelomomyces lativittatus]
MKRKGSTPRSHLLQRDFLTTCPDVLPHQWIGQVLDTQGHPLYLCTSKTNALEKEKEKGMRGVVAHLDAKYRHTVFVRRGAYVILHSLSDIDTVKSRSPPPIEAFIDHVLFPQHIKVMKKLGTWPFSSSSSSTSLDDSVEETHWVDEEEEDVFQGSTDDSESFEE